MQIKAPTTNTSTNNKNINNTKLILVDGGLFITKTDIAAIIVNHENITLFTNKFKDIAITRPNSRIEIIFSSEYKKHINFLDNALKTQLFKAGWYNTVILNINADFNVSDMAACIMKRLFSSAVNARFLDYEIICSIDTCSMLQIPDDKKSQLVKPNENTKKSVKGEKING